MVVTSARQAVMTKPFPTRTERTRPHPNHASCMRRAVRGRALSLPSGARPGKADGARNAARAEEEKRAGLAAGAKQKGAGKGAAKKAPRKGATPEAQASLGLPEADDS